MSNQNATSSGQIRSVPKFRRSDLPGLYLSASRAAKRNQSNYFRALLLYLFLLVLAAAVSYAAPEGTAGAALSAFLFIASLSALIYLKVKHPDDIWYNGRAVAESVKTIAWRWMMHADPYRVHSANDVDNDFIQDLEEILRENKSLHEYLSADEGSQSPISEKMREIRALTMSDRLEVYKTDRIENQRKYYSDKSKSNKRNADRCFLGSVVLHGVAAVLSILRIQDSPPDLPIEVVAALAGAVLTWLEAKKYRENTSAYKLAAHEIGFILGKADSITTEDTLSKFVQDSENAFSREHTQWVAKKSA